MYAFGFVSVWMFILTCTLQDPYVPQVMIDYTEVGPLFLESSGNFSAHSCSFLHIPVCKIFCTSLLPSNILCVSCFFSIEDWDRGFGTWLDHLLMPVIAPWSVEPSKM